MIRSFKSPLRFLAASLLVGGLSFASIASAMKIKIDPQGENMDSQPTETLDVPATDTIQRVKEILETREGGYPPELHDLYIGDTKLEDDKTLADYKEIQEGATLVLKMKP